MHTTRTESPRVLARLLVGLVVSSAGLGLAAAPATADGIGASPTSGAVTTDAAGISSAGMASSAPTTCKKLHKGTQVQRAAAKRSCGKRAGGH